MGKGKLAKFSDMEGFPHVFQCTYNDLKQTDDFAFSQKGKWHEFFGNNNPIVVELGCGKGEYTVGLAELFPDRNFIGVDIKGARMWTGAKDSLQKGLKNVAFVRTNIEALTGFFAKGEVSEIWLTFPDPQMKKVNKRLTGTVFMALYQQVLADGGLIHLKTDSNFMYTYTCAMVKENGYEVVFNTNNLYNSSFSDDKILSIKTYYEQQWLARGIDIKYITFKLTHRDSFVEPDIEIEHDSYRSFGRNARTVLPANKDKKSKSMMSFKEIQQYVVAELPKLDILKEPKGLYEPIKYELEVGGKRLRPALCLYTCQMFSGSFKQAYYPAMAFEVFHNYTLMHDDVMDNADMRRKKPTVHKVWNVNTAILSGDAMMGKAYELMARADDKIFKKVFTAFSDTAMGVFEGQQYDMEFEDRNDVTIDEYINMIRLKTSVLLAGAIKVGAICGGASEKDAEELYQFGVGLGLSFQLCDDLLDVYGDPKTFGKNIGGDICCNKKTFLYLKALEAAKGTEAEKQLLYWFNLPEFDRAEKIKAVTELYNQLGVREATEKTMDAQYAEAKQHLESTSVSREFKDELLALAKELLHRDY